MGFCLLPGVGATLENEALRIEFKADADGFDVNRLVNKLAGNVEFGERTISANRFWQLDLQKRDGGSNVTFVASNRSKCAAREQNGDGETMTFRWKGVDLPGEPGALDVAARVSLKKGSPLSEWTIQVRNRSESWALVRTRYPMVTCLVPMTDESAKVLVPYKNVGGMLMTAPEYKRDPIGKVFRYPSCRLQMMAVMRGEAGIYFAAHDRDCRDKTLVLRNDSSAWCETLVENAGVPGRAAEGPRYAVTIGAFKGDWWSAAHLYRDWATRQKWCAKGKIADRADYPKKAVDTHVWIIGGGRVPGAKLTLNRMKRVWPDLGKCLTWSEWGAVNDGPSNRNNPEFFPAHPGVPELAHEAVRDGFMIMPYLNGRIWDKATTGFAYARRDATMAADGSLNNEVYHSFGRGYDFAVMCPWCKTWREVMLMLAIRCLEEFGGNAVYFDQVSCSPPKPCYDPNHGHPLGGGKWWAEGYRQMFTEIKREFVRRDAVVVSEQMGEMWIDLIDVYLNALRAEKCDVPLFPAIYSGYMVHYGRPLALDAPEDLEFREYCRTFVWGEAFGWLPPCIAIDGVPGNRFERRASLVRDLATKRAAAKDFLVLGTLEDELRALEPDPDVFGTVWKNAKGDRWAVAVANVSKVEKTISYRLPGEKNVRKIKLKPREVKVQYE